MTISKTIHHIWLGKNEMPPLYKHCISTWSKEHPDWDIKLWTEESIDFSNKYIEKALKDKNYAFASDCLRVHILRIYGGVYLDVDIEIVKPLDELLDISSFLGYERENRVNCAVMGFESNHWLLNELCDYYDNHVGQYKAIPRIVSEIIEKCGHRDVKIYEPAYFYPYNPFIENKPKQLMYKDITPNTYAIHHWGNSWSISSFQKLKNLCLKLLK
ncbi:hypothetical protein KW426_15810 [Vibrio fluvialis]|nr:hypothetical protein [Vibrio fluvialis]MBY7774583.1 hypothetical protein [Vibrio fluvialis]MBY7778775.1 hypothetical protein [Vibrio fluvialis]MBY7988193.1 hypothetical protein [Vibrio fluvialis]MBY7993773.1 hypothetical protein [Vibrio fluvialis]